MPITLNHSNISVQYETGSNYIIETVKSDLFLRNENVDTVIRNNIQTAPVTPTTFVGSSGNVFGVEAYTYSGTANTADYTRVFPKNTTCDILIVGGGGGGGFAHGGGGGAGQLVLIHQATLNGSYTIKVGNGGVGGLNASTEPTKGINSEFGSVIAEGGGANGKTLKDGGSGAGGDGYTPSGGTTGGGNKNTTIDTFPGATVYSRGNNGGNNGGTDNGVGGGGGGAGEAGTTGQNSYPYGKGGDGLSGISEINYDFKTNFGINVGKTESDEKVWFAAGGGGGGLFAGFGGKGGGGAGAPNNNTKGFDATNNTGSGGGGGGGNGNEVMGGKGGSGIVIIKYLLGTIPTTNFLTNEPVVTAPTFTESVKAFLHSGGTEAQTFYTITIGQNTICDILIVGGGGGGGFSHGGGGGAGQLVLIHQATLNGTYTINVGKGGVGGSNTSTEPTKGVNSEFGNVIAEGGGANGKTLKDGGSGAGGDGYTLSVGTAGGGNKNTIIDTFPGATVYSKGNNGGNNGGANGSAGGGGGGAGEAGTTGQDSSPFGKGGDGLSGISEINYDFKTNFGINVGKTESDGNVWFAAGGGGGGSFAGNGGKGGGGAGAPNNNTPGSNATNNTGSGGGGGGGGGTNVMGGNGGSGIVIIKFKTIVGAAISEEISNTIRKRLNFVHNDNLLIYNFTPYNDLASWTAYATSFGATTLFNYFDSTGAWHVPSNGYVQLTLPNAYNQVKVNYNNPHVSGTFVRIYIDNVLKDTCTAGSSREYIQSYTSGQVLRIEEEGAIIGKNLIITLTNTNSQTYTLNFPVPTLTNINNNSNIVLRGAYDIALSSTNASIIPKNNQYIPLPTTFTIFTGESAERMYPPVRNFTADTTTISGQTYGNGTYIVTGSSFYDSSQTLFNLFNGTNVGWTESYVYNYDGSGGTYTGSSSFEGFPGEWIKIQLPVSIKLTKYIIEAGSIGGVSRAPSIYKIFGSNDDTVWKEVVFKSVALVSGNYVSNKFEEIVYSNNYYKYFALVISKNTGGDVWLSIGEWSIYGKEQVSNPLSISYSLLNPTLDPIGAQWTYSSNNTNVYHLGNVGIGTTSPEYSLDVRGNIYSSSGGYTQSGLTTWYIASDRRIKENIVKASYDKCLENVKNIELYNFNFKDNCVNTNDRHQLGFIAQEVQQVYPKAVEVGKMTLNTNERIDNVLTLNTTQIKYTLYGAVKELINKVEMLETKINM